MSRRPTSSHHHSVLLSSLETHLASASPRQTSSLTTDLGKPLDRGLGVHRGRLPTAKNRRLPLQKKDVQHTQKHKWGCGLSLGQGGGKKPPPVRMWSGYGGVSLHGQIPPMGVCPHEDVYIPLVSDHALEFTSHTLTPCDMTSTRRTRSQVQRSWMGCSLNAAYTTLCIEPRKNEMHYEKTIYSQGKYEMLISKDNSRGLGLHNHLDIHRRAPQDVGPSTVINCPLASATSKIMTAELGLWRLGLLAWIPGQSLGLNCDTISIFSGSSSQAIVF